MVQEISRRTDDYRFATRLRVRFAETDAQSRRPRALVPALSEAIL